MSISVLTDSVLKDEVPPDDEGNELPDRRVRVDIGRAGPGYPRAELGVADPRQRGGETCYGEGEDQRGPRHVARHGARQDVDADSCRTKHE